MSAPWKNILLRTFLPLMHKEDGAYTKYEMARARRTFRRNAFRVSRDTLFITLAIFSAAFGLEGFLIPNHFIDGGATGIALLCSQLFGLPLPVFLVIINIPFMILGYTMISRAFAIKTMLAITGLAVVTATIHFPVVTQDKLLVAVFSGFFLGTGIGLAVRGGAVIDGTEVLAIHLSKKLGTTIGDIVVIFNVFIFGAAAYLLSVEIALYSMITYLAASKTVDFVVEGIEEYIGVTIVSKKSEQIRAMITDQMGRGVTIYMENKGYGRSGAAKEINVIYTVITRLEISRLNTEMEKIDRNAFIVMTNVKDTKGGMIKKRRLKH